MLTYENIVENLFKRFPELKQRYMEDIEWIQDTFADKSSKGQTVYFDKCFCDYIGRNIVLEPNNLCRLNQIFTFLEEMASSDDVDVQNLLQVTVLEYLGSWFQLQSKALQLMGPNTLKLFNVVKQYLAEPQREDILYFEN